MCSREERRGGETEQANDSRNLSHMFEIEKKPNEECGTYCIMASGHNTACLIEVNRSNASFFSLAPRFMSCIMLTQACVRRFLIAAMASRMTHSRSIHTYLLIAIRPFIIMSFLSSFESYMREVPLSGLRERNGKRTNASHFSSTSLLLVVQNSYFCAVHSSVSTVISQR